MEKWIEIAKECGFSEAAPMDPATCKPMQMVRDACAADKCHAYGHNWTCPPECGTLEECMERMQKYQNGILLQTVGQLRRDIDTKGYMLTEQQHMEAFHKFADEIRKEYPDALCLGAGGCRICKTCAAIDNEPCRFPDKRQYSMEGSGMDIVSMSRKFNMIYNAGDHKLGYFYIVMY